MRSQQLTSWPLFGLLLLGSDQARVLVTAQRTQSDEAPTATTTESPTSTTSTAEKATHTIKVGPKNDPHQYYPHSIHANVGDEVVFEFYPRNHSVVQADFGAPCVPATGDYFYSGIFNDFEEENGQLVGDPPTWTLTINDTEPIFFYCTAIDSCIKNGMVGAINPNETMTWEDQFQKALNYPYMLVPGESPPAEGAVPPGSGNDGGDDDDDDDDDDDSSSGLSGGAIAGIVVGAVAGVALLGALFYLLGRNRVYSKWLTSEEGKSERTRTWLTGQGGAWSAADDSTIRPTDAVSSHPGHMSYMDTEMSQPGHMSMQYNAPLSPSPHQPQHWSWDGHGAVPVSPKPDMHETGLPELSSSTAIEVAELDGGTTISPGHGNAPAGGITPGNK
ncbi:hypothetical protein VTO42DRAFT_1591 [Malbranchea cinnamomea]